MSAVTNNTIMRLLELKKAYDEVDSDARQWSGQEIHLIRESIREEIEHCRDMIRAGLELDQRDKESLRRRVEEATRQRGVKEIGG